MERTPTNRQSGWGCLGQRSSALGGLGPGVHSDIHEGSATLAGTAVSCHKNHRPHSLPQSLFTHRILVLSLDTSQPPRQALAGFALVVSGQMTTESPRGGGSEVMSQVT